MKWIKIIPYRLLLLLLIIEAVVSCTDKRQFNGYLYPINENGLYGYIDSIGNKIIAPNFLWASTFRNGLAIAVVDTIYYEVEDSMAYKVGARDTILNIYRMYAKYGYIDKSGKFAIEPRFICYVNMPEKGFIVKDMEECSNVLYLHSFKSGRALFSDTVTWKNGYINTEGIIVIEPEYYYSEPFNDGLAVVRKDVAEPIFTNGACINPSRLRCAYIDTLGNNVTEFNYETLTKFSSGFGIGTFKKIEKNPDYGFEEYREPRYLINRNGTEIKELDFSFHYYGYTQDGITVALQEFLWMIRQERNYYFFDKKGNILKPLNGLSNYQLDSLNRCEDVIQVFPENIPITDATYFNDGFAGITPDNEHWLVIDKYFIIHGYGDESVFEAFKPFNYKLAAVKKNGKWGYINTKIKEQIPCKYDSCGFVYPYLEEVFELDTQGNIKRKTYINRKDSLIWKSAPYDSKVNNFYSNKNEKDWGKWKYRYNDSYWFSNGTLLVLMILAIISVTSLVVIIKKSFSNKQVNKMINGELDKQTKLDESADIYSNIVEKEDVVISYPTVGQYTDIIKQTTKSPDDYFDKLRNLRPVLDNHGEPVMSSGNFAVVFEMEDAHGKKYAVRCFHRAQQGRDTNYKLICEELSKVSSPYLSRIKYYEKELFVDEREYPVLLMDWVEGVTLDKYIRSIIDNGQSLKKLARNFRKLAIWLLNQPFAHGDLKPDNILVKTDGSLVLVDYDGMYVPSMKGQKAKEIGSPDFRNPSRTENDFNKDIDSLPIISILLSLEMLVENKLYLSQYGAEDRLLFSANDYSNLNDSRVFKLAITSDNSFVSKLAIIMRKCINGLCNNNDLISFLDTNSKFNTINNSAYNKASFIVLVIAFLGISYFSLFLRSYYQWHILLVSAAILLAVVGVLSFCTIIDIFRPKQEEHLAFFDEDYIVGFAYIAVVPLFLMGDFFSNWINSFDLPLISDLPFYNDKWYVTALIWVASFIIIWVTLNMPNTLLDLRMRYYLSSQEKTIKSEQEEINNIRRKLEEEERKRLQNRHRCYYDDFPFDFDDYNDYDFFD